MKRKQEASEESEKQEARAEMQEVRKKDRREEVKERKKREKGRYSPLQRRDIWVGPFGLSRGRSL